MRSIVRGACAVLLVLMVGYAAFHLGSSADRSHSAAKLNTTGVATSARPGHHGSLRAIPLASTNSVAEWDRTARRFVDAFLDHSRAREVRLRVVASSRLATLLARTDPEKIPAGRPTGGLELVAESAETVTVSQQLSDGSVIAFDLVPDAAKAGGWVVTSVRPGVR